MGYWGGDFVLSRVAGLMSSGLAEKWYKLVKEKSVTKYVKIAERERQAWKGLKFENLMGILPIFLACCTISAVTFSVEGLLFCKRRTKVLYL